MNLNKLQQDAINDAMKELIDAPAFTGVTVWEDLGVVPGYQGSTAGYYAGGNAPPGTPTSSTITQYGSYFPFATDTPGAPTTFVNLGSNRWKHATSSSPTNGYSWGGDDGTPVPAIVNNINSFAFASGSSSITNPSVNGTQVGSSGCDTVAGNGYVIGGRDIDATPLAPVSYFTGTVNRYSHSSSANTVVTSLFPLYAYGGGVSSPLQGRAYHFNGQKYPTPTVITAAYSYPFSTPFVFSSVITGLSPKYNMHPHGQNSGEYGYIAGGFPAVSAIQKFPFASIPTTISSVGNLSQSAPSANGISSTSNGYTVGFNGFPFISKIDKFPFASDANATTVGGLDLATVTVGTYQV
jgi:hypothetical protein